MAGYPPFMNAYGQISKILTKINEAKTTDRFTRDYLGETLGFKTSGARAFIPFAKRIGLLNSAGEPTKLYKSFRNPKESGPAIAKAIERGYSELYERNERAHLLSKKELEGLLIEITGLEKGDNTLRAISGSFLALKEFAKFGAIKKLRKEDKKEDEAPPPGFEELPSEEIKLNLGYTINLVLPKTDDVTVFNAIFKSLRENLLRK